MPFSSAACSRPRPPRNPLPRTSPTPPAGAKKFTSDEILHLMVGKTLSSRTDSQNLPYSMEIVPNGKLKGEGVRSSGAGKIYDSGKWEVKDNQLCITWEVAEQRRALSSHRAGCPRPVPLSSRAADRSSSPWRSDLHTTAIGLAPIAKPSRCGYSFRARLTASRRAWGLRGGWRRLLT